MAKRIETKSHNVLRASSTFEEVAREKVVGENYFDPSPILNKVNPMFPWRWNYPNNLYCKLVGGTFFDPSSMNSTDQFLYNRNIGLKWLMG